MATIAKEVIELDLHIVERRGQSGGLAKRCAAPALVESLA
jgi:hypothetical protein